MLLPAALLAFGLILVAPSGALSFSSDGSSEGLRSLVSMKAVRSETEAPSTAAPEMSFAASNDSEADLRPPSMTAAELELPPLPPPADSVPTSRGFLAAQPMLGALVFGEVDSVVEARKVHTFYLYRAMNDYTYPIGNENMGNLPGVMWYLSNEVMPRCPKRYNIQRIKRIKVHYKATSELFDRGMNFGVRYSYDAGKCTGSNTRLMGSCNRTWDRFGYVLGCNKFTSHYPWPIVDTVYPDGVWYGLPIEGRCDHPTGEWNCTWSYEDAGEVMLEELEQNVTGYGYCCGGNCTGFWDGRFLSSFCDRRLQQTYDLFAAKYPDMPRDLPVPDCDFERASFWQ